MAGNSEGDNPGKPPKASGTQEQPPTSAAPVYPEWSPFQAFYGTGATVPPAGFFHSSVASSPQAHPYMWGQHLIPSFGGPHHPYVMYPPGGLYAHPSIPAGSHPFSPYAMPSPSCNPDVSVAVPTGMETDGRSSDGKEKSPKRSKDSLGSLNMLTGKDNDAEGKVTEAASNGVFSQSGESATEGSSEGSDANSQNGSQQKASRKQGSVDAIEASQNGGTMQNGTNHPPPPPQLLNQPMPIMTLPAGGKPGAAPGPTTNLNIGMDYWGGAVSSPIPAVRGKLPATASPVPGAILPSNLSGSRENVPSDLWIQDERELKRQKRKQSNRESARRSRLRKQAECEELALRVETLKEENSSLRAELSHIRAELEQLHAQNTSLREKLGEPADDGNVDSKADQENLETGLVDQ